MKYQHALDAIKDILDQVPDEELPKPSKIEATIDGKQCVWFGGLGYYLGSARTGKANGKKVRNSMIHRERGVSHALVCEAVYRLDLAYTPEPLP